jgi:glycosyltransferase involved in cell wall biosynthesis
VTTVVSDHPRIEVAQIVTRFIAGAGGVALRGALQLDPDRYHVTVVTGEGGELTRVAAERGLDVVIEPSLVSPISPREDATALRRLTELCRDRAFDVVHTHSAKAGALGRIAAHRAGAPVIVHTYHGFPFHDFQSPVRRAAYVAIERRLAPITDVVLAIGSGVATEALRRGLARAEGLRIVAPAVQADTVVRTPQHRKAARAALGIDGERPVVGTVGRVDFQKAPEHFVEAVAALRSRDALAVWVGSGPQLDEARRLAKERGLGGRMIFAGERSDVARLLPAFDVFALASRYEGLPCALVEAMRCGLPVVATAVNSVPDLIIPGESGLLVRPGRPRELAAAIDTLLEDDALARRCAERGRELAGTQFDAERLGVVLDEVYSQGLGLDATMAMAR